MFLSDSDSFLCTVTNLTTCFRRYGSYLLFSVVHGHRVGFPLTRKVSKGLYSPAFKPVQVPPRTHLWQYVDAFVAPPEGQV